MHATRRLTEVNIGIKVFENHLIHVKVLLGQEIHMQKQRAHISVINYGKVIVYLRDSSSHRG